VTVYLVVAAHPDDADFGVAGTAAALTRGGDQVHYLVCTSGEAGTEDPAIAPTELARLREREQDAAGHVLGLAGVRYLRWADGELEPSMALRRAIVRVIRELKADVVVCQDPRLLVSDDGRYLNHPDHRAAGQAALDAAWPTAGNPAAFRDLLVEGLPAQRVREIWLFFTNAENANHWVDISETLELKIQALACHDSQIGDWARDGGLATEMTKWAEEEVQRRQLPYRYAETFQRIVIRVEEEQPPRG
jgi:LmbE family N-acetylglucosaminyl deacetylase